MTANENKLTQDEALADKLADLLGIESPSGAGGHANEELVEVASELRKQVIDPAVIAGSLKLLKAHRNALYDSMPTGVDLDAMDLLNLIQTHLGKVDASIESLENTLKPVEVFEGENKKSPLQTLKGSAQEAEVVDSEDAKS